MDCYQSVTNWCCTHSCFSIRIRSGKHIDMKPLSKSEAESFISNYYPIELRTLFDRS